MTSWEERILGKMSILQKPIVQNVMRGKLSSCNCKFEALMNLVSLEEVKKRQDVVRRDGRESIWSELEVGIDDSHWQRANETERGRERGLNKFWIGRRGQKEVQQEDERSYLD